MKTNETSNQKQFKQFDESLFKAYINKFSDEDKLKCLNIIKESVGISEMRYKIGKDTIFI
jgi:hypothetical protein